MSMHSAVLTGTGLYQLPFTITMPSWSKLLTAMRGFWHNRHADAIARGEQQALQHSERGVH